MEKDTVKKIKQSPRGFALLFAILASSFLVSIALAIWNIASREVIFSSFGRESQLAFFSADSGAECALYWDLGRVNSFATSTDSATTNPPLTCANMIVTPISFGRTSTKAINTFTINDNSAVCAYVTVSKDSGRTEIESRGRNTCNDSDQTIVERGLRVTY